LNYSPIKPCLHYLI